MENKNATGKTKQSKMTRQLRIFHYLIHHEIHGPDDFLRLFNVGRRMLQRDLKDLRDSGLINVRYDRTSNNYVPDKEAVFDETAPFRRRQHLCRLYRLGTLIRNLEPNDEEFSDFLIAMEDYEYDLENCRTDPDAYPEDELTVPVADFMDIIDVYDSLFPDSTRRTRQRDFQELTNAGFMIRYDRSYKVFVITDNMDPDEEF